MNALVPVVVTFLVYYFSKRYKILLDYPDSRKNHHLPTPQIGGIILFISLLFLFRLNENILFSLGILLSFFFGIIDDAKNLSYKSKFLLESIIALIFVLNSNLTLFGYSGIFVKIFTFFWFLAIVNGFNMIDGLNGLSTGVLLIYSLFLKRYDLSFIYLPIYLFNLFGKFFMGESGTLLSSFLLITILSNSNGELVYLTLFFGYPAYEVVSSFIRRIISGKSPFLPDRKHLHHVFSERFGNVKFLIFAYIISSVFVLLSHKFYGVFIYIFICLFLFAFQRKFERSNSNLNL
ncbi:MAG: undecaprenyl/decaprenyl-phosphate alpha-N-acetylglucosaminyl 1-phosphate transferase [Thermosipho sp. (in: Bacteria)]|nr:undecaprenyl/decaprenyl-phosphate alpha-N-acetylglucosaminyl 1-phosphate transferase [Thermosipho sp. (in: thermotogales)]